MSWGKTESADSPLRRPGIRTGHNFLGHGSRRFKDGGCGGDLFVISDLRSHMRNVDSGLRSCDLLSRRFLHRRFKFRHRSCWSRNHWIHLLVSECAFQE